MDDNSGMSIGLAIGLGRRMRQDEEAHQWEMHLQRVQHEEDLANFQAGIDQVRTERDNFEARLIARNHQVRVMWALIGLILQDLGPGHPYASPVEEVDMAGSRMTHMGKAVGTHMLNQALMDKEPYHETFREVAKLVGVRPGHHEAIALRAELARGGRWKTAAALRDALKAQPLPG